MSYPCMYHNKAKRWYPTRLMGMTGSMAWAPGWKHRRLCPSGEGRSRIPLLAASSLVADRLGPCLVATGWLALLKTTAVRTLRGGIPCRNVVDRIKLDLNISLSLKSVDDQSHCLLHSADTLSTHP